MQQLIEDLKSIPGVIGAYVYHPEEGVRANNLPPLFKTERITETAKNLVKITAAGRHNFHDLSEIFLNFEESAILCRQLAGTNYVVTFCDPDINFNVLSMSLNLAMEEVNSRIVTRKFSAAEAAPPPPVHSPGTSAAAPSKPPDPSTLNLDKTLEDLAQILTKFLGPMARIVFDDTLENWSKENPLSTETLPVLVDSLCQEIDEENKRKKFREMVQENLPFALG